MGLWMADSTHTHTLPSEDSQIHVQDLLLTEVRVYFEKTLEVKSLSLGLHFASGLPVDAS